VISDDDHVTNVVMSAVVPSLYVPVATNCCVVPFGMLGDDGVTSMLFRTAAVTVNFVDPFTLDTVSVAVIVVVPGAIAVASPSESFALETVATPASEDDHVTVVVTSDVVPSLNVPVATNCLVVAFGMEGVVGVTS